MATAQAVRAPRPGSRGNKRNQKKPTVQEPSALTVSAAAAAHERELEAYMDAPGKGRLEAMAVKRYREDRARDDLTFDVKSAARAINFVQAYCKHTTGEWHGEAFELAPWQKFVVWNLFGFKMEGVRRFRYALVSVARKNGKSTLAAAIALYMQIADQEPRAQLVVASTKVEQSNIVFGEADAMLGANKTLGDRFLRYNNKLVCPELESVFRPISADKPYDGLSPHLVVLDEVHAWREVHRKFFNTMKTGGASRRQPILLVITTAGDDASTIYNEEWEYCAKVLEGLIPDDRTFAYLACLDEADDPLSKEIGGADWDDLMRKANPNIGTSCKREYLIDQAREAKSKPSMRNAFLRYHCNMQTASSERVIGPDTWNSCLGKVLSGEPIAVHGGFDLARSNDFAAWAVVRQYKGGLYELITKSYTCKHRTDDLKVPFIQRWVEDGYLIEHLGNQINFDQFEEDVKAATHEYGVSTWAFDPTFAAQMAQHLTEEFGENVPFKFTQSARHYNEPFRKFERAVCSGKIRHDGNPCLAWQAGNLMVKRNPRDEWMPDKSAQKSKIDAMVAVLMAFSECLFAENEQAWSAEELGI